MPDFNSVGQLYYWPHPLRLKLFHCLWHQDFWSSDPMIRSFIFTNTYLKDSDKPLLRAQKLILLWISCGLVFITISSRIGWRDIDLPCVLRAQPLPFLADGLPAWQAGLRIQLGAFTNPGRSGPD